MNNYYKEKHAIPIPWVESPFFESLLKESDLDKEDKERCAFYNKNGYLQIDLDLSESEIKSVVGDMYQALENEKTKYHADHFQYTENKRIFELWKQSKAAAEMCMNHKVMDILRMLYHREPFPFSTINFFKGSNQPLHSDTIHFHTVPSRWMVGVWIALEDVNETNGSLKIIPGSHKWNIWEYDDLGYPHPDDLSNGEEIIYRKYENFLVDLIKEKKAKPYIANLKKGQALIWAANLLHGGSNVPGITDLTKTRYTQAQHYFFEGCEKYYHPMFTRKYEGRYAEKWCNTDNNIATFLETGEVKMFDEVVTTKNGL